MFDTLLTMEASGAGSSGSSEELIAYEVAQITEKLSQRGRFDVPGIQMQYPVLCDLGVPRRCLHFNTTRVHLTMTWVVSFLILSDAPRRPRRLSNR